MKGILLLRLVDVTLLLLLSFVAAGRIRTESIEIPVTTSLTESGSLLLPIAATITENGAIMVDGRPVPLLTIAEQASARGVEFLVDADAEVDLLLRAAGLLQEHGIDAVFLVETRQ